MTREPRLARIFSHTQLSTPISLCYSTTMSQSTADIVICGAGIAGISAAYHLAVNHGMRNVLLVDERPPMSLTSDKSTEAYRNWWPGPDDAMLRLMNRSIDLLELLDDANDHRLRLNRRAGSVGRVWGWGVGCRLPGAGRAGGTHRDTPASFPCGSNTPGRPGEPGIDGRRVGPRTAAIAD